MTVERLLVLLVDDFAVDQGRLYEGPIVQRVTIENQDVRVLALLDRADPGVGADDASGIQGDGAQGLAVLESTAHRKCRVDLRRIEVLAEDAARAHTRTAAEASRRAGDADRHAGLG